MTNKFKRLTVDSSASAMTVKADTQTELDDINAESGSEVVSIMEYVNEEMAKIVVIIAYNIP